MIARFSQCQYLGVGPPEQDAVVAQIADYDLNAATDHGNAVSVLPPAFLFPTVTGSAKNLSFVIRWKNRWEASLITKTDESDWTLAERGDIKDC